MATKAMRAYALATELGLEREELIKKAAEIGIEIRNPMASLDEETVATIRRRLSTTPAQDTVQKRVGSSVMRRRKRKDEPEAADETGAVAEVTHSAEPDLAEPAPLAASAEAVAPVAESPARSTEPRVFAPLDRPAR